MARKQKQPSPKPAGGLPVPPWIFINNSLGTGNSYADALCSLIPGSSLYEPGNPLNPAEQCSSSNAISVWANSSTTAYATADTARAYQIKALEQGCNFAYVGLCNDDTFNDFLIVEEKYWTNNQVVMEVAGASVEETAKRIVRWLYPVTVFSVRETLHLISEAEMLAADKKIFAEYRYCSLQQVHNQPKEARLQFVALIASKPELAEPNKLTWKVVDRSGEANFYFYHRGPASQVTWDWVLDLQVGDRKVLARMPMVALHEPVAKKILLSPLRATGTTIRGIGHATMGVGKAVHWVGDKVSVRRQESEKYIAEVDYEEHVKKRTERAWQKMIAARKKKEQKQKGERSKGGGSSAHNGIGSHAAYKNKKEETDFKIFNEKGEKTWSHEYDDSASTTTAAASLVDEKVEKEFC